jgi:hypothetical protein
LIRKPLTVDHYFFSNAQVCWYYIFFKCTGMLILYFFQMHIVIPGCWYGMCRVCLCI